MLSLACMVFGLMARSLTPARLPAPCLQVLHNDKLIPERCIQPSDIAEAALLPLRLSPDAVPLELVMKVRWEWGPRRSLGALGMQAR